VPPPLLPFLLPHQFSLLTQTEPHRATQSHTEPHRGEICQASSTTETKSSCMADAAGWLQRQFHTTARPHTPDPAAQQDQTQQMMARHAWPGTCSRQQSSRGWLAGSCAGQQHRSDSQCGNSNVDSSTGRIHNVVKCSKAFPSNNSGGVRLSHCRIYLSSCNCCSNLRSCPSGWCCWWGWPPGTAGSVLQLNDCSRLPQKVTGIQALRHIHAGGA
jgi:hypothetical protein